MPKKISSSTRYAFAIGSVLVATMIRMLLTPFFGAEFAFLPFYIAVVFTTWFAGFAPGIFSILLGFIAANALVYVHTAVDADPLAITAYLALTLTIAFMGKSMHEARWRAELYCNEARQRQQDLVARSQEIKDEADRRAKADCALAVVEERFNALFEYPGAAIAEIESSSGRFLRVSNRLCQMTGYTAEELLQMEMRQLAYPADNEWDTRAFRRMIEGQSPESAAEKRYVGKNGRTIWVSVVAVPIRDLQGPGNSTLIAAQDVSVRRQAQEAAQSAQQRLRSYATDLEREVAARTATLTQTVVSLEDFCYSVSHQLLGPIHRVHTNAQVLIEKLDLAPPAMEHARRISLSAGMLSEMVQNLLDYGRLAREPVPLQTLHLETIIDHVLVQLAPEISSSRAEIAVQSPISPVRGHPLFLQKVFFNLLRNAITYVAPQTQPKVLIRAEDLAGAVRISINDNGVGIAPGDHDKIFHIFVRLEQPGDHVGGGTGLAIVKKAVEKMNGRVGLQSKPGTGSSFWVELPKPGEAA